MLQFIDRRPNPRDKSLGNRQRFMRRVRERVKEVVNGSIRDRKVSDIAKGDAVTISNKDISEPRFSHAPSGGRRQATLPGNKEYSTGDTIARPPSGGRGGCGKQAADDGEGQDEFQFTLSRDEFLDLFFEDLELPDLTKKSLRANHTIKMRRAGHTSAGVPANMNVLRTMRASLGRRIALGRPCSRDIAELKVEMADLESREGESQERAERLNALAHQLEVLERKRRVVPYIDPYEIRYNLFRPTPEPNSKAIMFCLMDVSGSMGEREKDLSKRFFVLLHLFLERCYEHTEIVFIRHTHEASEVDEDTFFYSRETGGTKVSTALHEMRKVAAARYPATEWNIYAAQASDGENYMGDSEECVTLLEQEIMPLCQYYAYVEIIDEREKEIFKDVENGAALWRSYRGVSKNWRNFATKRVATPGDIYPVFRELFSKQLEDG